MIQVTYQLNNQSGDQVDLIIIPDIYPTKEPITAPVFGDSIRYTSIFTRAIHIVYSSISISDDPNNHPSQVTIIKPPIAPSETPTKDPYNVPK